MMKKTPYEDIFECNKCKKQTIQTVFVLPQPDGTELYLVVCRRCGRVDELKFYLPANDE